MLVVISLLSTALTGTAAVAIEQPAITTTPKDWVLFDIKANSQPPKYLKCTVDNIGDRKFSLSPYSSFVVDSVVCSSEFGLTYTRIALWRNPGFCGENRHSIYTCTMNESSKKPVWVYDEATGTDGNGCAVSHIHPGQFLFVLLQCPSPKKQKPRTWLIPLFFFFGRFPLWRTSDQMLQTVGHWCMYRYPSHIHGQELLRCTPKTEQIGTVDWFRKKNWLDTTWVELNIPFKKSSLCHLRVPLYQIPRVLVVTFQNLYLVYHHNNMCVSCLWTLCLSLVFQSFGTSLPFFSTSPSLDHCQVGGFRWYQYASQVSLKKMWKWSTFPSRASHPSW